MRVLALVPNVLGFAPGQRSSIEAWVKPLAEAGITVEFSVFETPELHDVLYRRGAYLGKTAQMARAYARRAGVVRRSVDDFDAILIYREAALAGPALFERLVARRKIPIIYQLDDPLHVPYKSHVNGYLSYLKFFGKVAKICAMSHVVIVNSSPLRKWVEQHNGNVWQIPSVVDIDKYTYVPSARTGKDVCVGWTGSPSTAPNLGLIAGALRTVQADTNSRIRLIGSTSFDLPGVEHTATAWDPITEVEDLREIDIGLVPVPVNPWNEWKFFMKVAQYMALGIPPVATPIGEIPEDIEHGVDGFLAATEGEWVEYIERLVHDDELRNKMSAAAATTARERFSLQANSQKIVDAFRSAQEAHTSSR